MQALIVFLAAATVGQYGGGGGGGTNYNGPKSSAVLYPPAYTLARPNNGSGTAWIIAFSIVQTYSPGQAVQGITFIECLQSDGTWATASAARPIQVAPTENSWIVTNEGGFGPGAYTVRQAVYAPTPNGGPWVLAGASQPQTLTVPATGQPTQSGGTGNWTVTCP